MDVRELGPSEMLRLINSTQLGEVLTTHMLKRHRDAAGFAIGQGAKLDLYKYCAWLLARRNSEDWNDDTPKTYAELAQRLGVTTKTVNSWRDNNADWPARNEDRTFDMQAVDEFCKTKRLGPYNPHHGMHLAGDESKDVSHVKALMDVRRDLTSERTRRERAQATQAEIELAQTAKDIVLVTDVVDLYEQTRGVVASIIDSVADVHDREMPEAVPSTQESWEEIRSRILEVDRKLIRDIQKAMEELQP